MSKQTWVYIIFDCLTGFYKIGKSDDPEKRLKQLTKQDTLQPLPNEYRLCDAWWADESCERSLHKFFAKQRQRGEWFALSDLDLRIIETFFYENIHYFHKLSCKQVHFGQPSQRNPDILFRNDVFIENANTVDYILETDGAFN
jgi:hypothetical protein